MNADDNDTPTLAEIVEEAAERIARRSLGGWLPGRVESFDSATCRATIQPLVLENDVDEQGARITRRYPVINDVPIVSLGGGGIRIRVPIVKGDTVYLLFGARSMDKFKATGGTNEVDPDDERHHDLSDAIAIPAELVNPRNAAAFIEFTSAGLIKCGGDEPLVTRSEFLGHTHATAATGAPSPPITGTPGSAITFPGTGKLRG